jgi:DNA-binding LacI/PurR family transcriptional regulator
MDYLIDQIVLDKSEGKSQPLHMQIYNKIVDLIQNNNFRIGVTLPSASSLANQLGVHYYTVRQAYDTLVSEGILIYKRNRGYTLHKLISPQTSERNAIMFIRPGSEAFSMSLCKGIRQYATNEKIELIEVDCYTHENEAIEAILNPSPTVGGILVMPFNKPHYIEALHKVDDQGIKVVLLDRDLPGFSFSCVLSDHFGGAFDATCHLLMEHDGPVYYFGWTKEPTSSLNWYRGWQEAMREYNYETKSCVIEVPYSEAEMHDKRTIHYQLIRKVFHDNIEKFKQKPFSILAGNDYMANYVCQAAQELGIHAGKDMFTASFSNAPLCEKVPVPLTSVEQNPEKVGYEGAKLLYEQMLNYSSGIKNILIPTELHIRMSSIGTTS